MDAYDEDPGAGPGPGGPAGARLPDAPPADLGSRAGTDAGEAEPAESSGDAGDAGGAGGEQPVLLAQRPRQEQADPTSGPGHGTPAEQTARTAPSAQTAGPDEPAPVPSATPRRGVAALSPRYQIAAALALAVVGVAVGVHLLMVFLSLAPANTVTKQHGKAVEEWVYPEFEQNWKLFAPNPLQQNIAVQVRAVVRVKDGGLRTTGWTDLSAQDGAAIDGNPVPSHTQQNELRRAWDFFVATHSTDNRPVGMRGALSEQYLRRIVVMRLYRTYPAGRDGVVQRVQIRSSTTNVQPPEWSRERVSDKPVFRVLPWWTVTADEAAGGVR
ncbi:DUF5819 family protein [Streptomyces sp. NPDC046759]|uniref:DUF5819 family protein n=1 Tax=Streptomyces sp. NPDC046759 TaxID=3155019 RepID=UPI0033D8DB64